MPDPRTRDLPNSMALFRVGFDHLGTAGTIVSNGPTLEEQQ